MANKPKGTPAKESTADPKSPEEKAAEEKPTAAPKQPSAEKAAEEKPAAAPKQPSPEDEDDPFAGLRLDQSYSDASVAVEDLILQVPFRRPGKMEFIRVHPTYRWDTQMIDLGMAGGVFLIREALVPLLLDFIGPVSLRLAITSQKVVFIWPLKLQKGDLPNAWNTSAMAVAEEATRKWVQLKSDKGFYRARSPVSDFGEPVWPNKTWAELFKIAKAGREILTMDHPVVKEIIGKIE